MTKLVPTRQAQVDRPTKRRRPQPKVVLDLWEEVKPGDLVEIFTNGSWWEINLIRNRRPSTRHPNELIGATVRTNSLNWEDGGTASTHMRIDRHVRLQRPFTLGAEMTSSTGTVFRVKVDSVLVMGS